jgi:hypothetical protein
MEMSGQRHALGALYPRGKDLPVPIGQEAGWAPEPVPCLEHILKYDQGFEMNSSPNSYVQLSHLTTVLYQPLLHCTKPVHDICLFNRCAVK